MPLTNEQFAEFIQQGNEDLKPVLWERCKKLLYSFAGNYYRLYTEYCDRCGVTEWDLKQQAYTAYENSFAGYDRSRGTYSNYLMFMFKSSIRGLFKNKDPLNYADSLDRLIDTEDEGNATVGDLIQDTEASEAFEQIEDNSVAAVVRKSVEELPDRERTVIKARYFDGRSCSHIAADIGVSAERVHQLVGTALGILHRKKAIRRLADELGYTSQRAYSNNLSSFNRYGMSGVERVAIERADINRSLQNWIVRREMARERLASGGSYEEYEKALEEIGDYAF